MRALKNIAAITVAWLGILAGGCTGEAPEPLTLDVGAHRVVFEAPEGWQLIDRGAEQFFKRDFDQIFLNDAGAVTVDGAAATSGKVRLEEGQTIAIDPAGFPRVEPPGPDAAVAFRVVHEDDSVIEAALAAFGEKYPDEWDKWEPRFRKGLADGSRVLVDENYIRESILEPQARIVAGYEPVMPTYQGRLSDPEIMAIIEYLKAPESATPEE